MISVSSARSLHASACVSNHTNIYTDIASNSEPKGLKLLSYAKHNYQTTKPEFRMSIRTRNTAVIIDAYAENSNSSQPVHVKFPLPGAMAVHVAAGEVVVFLAAGRAQSMRSWPTQPARSTWPYRQGTLPHAAHAAFHRVAWRRTAVRRCCHCCCRCGLTSHYVSHVTCHMSHVTCHMSGARCQVPGAR